MIFVQVARQNYEDTIFIAVSKLLLDFYFSKPKAKWLFLLPIWIHDSISNTEKNKDR